MSETPKTPAENAQEVFDLVKAYAIQETAAPLSGVGRYLKFGVPGAVCLGLGFFFLALALLRGLQEIDVFSDRGDDFGFNWGPYFIVVFVAIVIIALLARRITKGLSS